MYIIIQLFLYQLINHFIQLIILNHYSNHHFNYINYLIIHYHYIHIHLLTKDILSNKIIINFIIKDNSFIIITDLRIIIIQLILDYNLQY